MKSANKKEIQEAFTHQAAKFEGTGMSFSKQDYLNYTVSRIAPAKTDAVLEVAAGTCACGRALAPYAGSVTCIDMTAAMLSVGEEAAKKEDIRNMRFVSGDAAELPFADNSFDIVFSRLAFHHFPDVEVPFSEMVRVTKFGGKLVMIDMEAAEESLRSTEDRIEILRDPSHVRNLSLSEMLMLYKQHGIDVKLSESAKIPVELANWLELTSPGEKVCADIVNLMEDELSGGAGTGFSPYRKDGRIFFDQRWRMIIGQK